MKKKITKVFLITVLVIAVCLTVFLLIFNTSSNKLKRYLKSEGYTCNKTLCTKKIKTTQYQINYKKCYYHYEDDDLTIDISKEKTLVQPVNKITACTFHKKDDNKLTTFTDADSSSNCLIYLEKVNIEVNNFKDILKEAKVDFNKLSK